MSEAWRATTFSSTRQPAKRGRKKNVFGPLAKENNLTNDDVKKIFKNLLVCKPEEMSKIVEKYPTTLTIATANMLAQEMKGELTGRYVPTGRKIPTFNQSGDVQMDANGQPVMIDEMVPERKRSYDMVKYMIDRCFGKPVEAGVLLTGPVDSDLQQTVEEIFGNAMESSENSAPLYIEARVVSEENEE
ncbi:hypothetical protein AGMMS49944_04150 [Spirochaetia bacterium]|nr:hypothetical protein AGMMS49944_04150 [Spirochaetia bacterium]